MTIKNAAFSPELSNRFSELALRLKL